MDNQTERRSAPEFQCALTLCSASHVMYMDVHHPKGPAMWQMVSISPPNNPGRKKEIRLRLDAHRLGMCHFLSSAAVQKLPPWMELTSGCIMQLVPPEQGSVQSSQAQRAPARGVASAALILAWSQGGCILLAAVPVIGSARLQPSNCPVSQLWYISAPLRSQVLRIRLSARRRYNKS